MSVGYLRSSVSLPRSQNTPPPHKRTHAERARAPPPAPHTAPALAPNAEDPRDKHPHPPSRCARQQITPPGCGYCALRPMRGYRKRPDSRGAPGSFKCPVV
ncbi:hypothetical protein DPMN_144597 [Dreissena polymorpha]|uniref:Uncharacterized protein n=1 Tax=Dreissena polymorpha TaxID=45954 RepID=A0A9D4F899_DREPO|nr:hypothetical protein DPMN_144597 [Dreissena polymorpha]